MSFVHGKNLFVKFGTASSETDISAYCDDFQAPAALDEVETTTFGATAKTYLTGFADYTVSLGGPWDPTLDGILDPALGQTKSLVWSMNGGTASATNPQWTGTAILKKYDKSAGVGAAVKWKAEIRISGAPTRATS
jgi:hypothetical protein